MIKEIVAFKLTNLLIFSFLVYLASFAIPTGALFLILSFSSISVGPTEILIIFGITFLSAVLGDISTYFFARLFSSKAMKLMEFNNSLKKSQKRINLFFKKNGFYTIFFSRFLLSSLGTVINYYCGFTKYNHKKFILAIFLGELFYASIYTSLGIIFRDFISEILNLINGIFVILLLLILMGIVFKKIRKEIEE